MESLLSHLTASDAVVNTMVFVGGVLVGKYQVAGRVLLALAARLKRK